MDLNTKIAGNKTKADWLALRVNLRANLGNISTDFWQDAFDNYFRKRLKTKFLDSLGNIIKTNEKQMQEFKNNPDPNRKKEYFLGEGFSMVIIECVVLEILASFREGETSNAILRIADDDIEFYRTKDIDHEDRVGKDSKELLIKFLRCKMPFSNDFGTDTGIQRYPKLAHYFYANFRNHLIHNGDTNHNCKIKAINKTTPNLIICEINKNGRKETVLYRNALYFAILRYLTLYRAEIVKSANIVLRLNFLLKMDDLCQTNEN